MSVAFFISCPSYFIVCFPSHCLKLFLEELYSKSVDVLWGEAHHANVDSLLSGKYIIYYLCVMT